MLGNRSRDTEPELALRRRLHALGMRFYVDRRPIPSLRRTADVLFPVTQVAVFVDGCYWHGCVMHCHLPTTNADYWRTKIYRTKVRDASTTATLEAAGWIVVRVWEHDDSDEAAKAVAAVVRARRSAGPLRPPLPTNRSASEQSTTV